MNDEPEDFIVLSSASGSRSSQLLPCETPCEKTDPKSAKLSKNWGRYANAKSNDSKGFQLFEEVWKLGGSIRINFGTLHPGGLASIMNPTTPLQPIQSFRPEGEISRTLACARDDRVEIAILRCRVNVIRCLLKPPFPLQAFILIRSKGRCSVAFPRHASNRWSDGLGPSRSRLTISASLVLIPRPAV